MGRREQLGDTTLVDTIPDGFTLMEERTWGHPDLYAWLDQYAVVYKADMGGEGAGDFARLMRESGRRLDAFPHAMVYFKGRLVATLPRTDPFDKLTAKIRGGRQEGYPDPSRFFPKPEQVLEAGYFTLERAQAVDPLWFAQHEQLNPFPVVQIDQLHKRDDGLAPVFREPRDADIKTVLDAWSVARELAAQGDARGAAGLYTWLWERSSQIEPALDGVRCWLLGGEMADLARKDRDARQRFTDMHGATGSWWLHLSSEQWLDYFTLGEITGRQTWTMEYLIGRTVGWFEHAKTTPGDIAFRSPSEDAIYALLTERDRWTDPEGASSSVRQRMERHAAALRRLNSRNSTAEDMDEVIALYRRVLRHEVTRVYVEFIEAGREQQAGELAAWYIEHEHLGEEFARRVLELTRELALAD